MNVCDGQRAAVFANVVLKMVSFACFLEVDLGRHKL